MKNLMILTELISSIRVELADTTPALYHYSDDDLIRSIEKSISLMSRLIPKRSIVETTIRGAIIGETLTIASNTGTLASSPVKVGSVVITGKRLYTDYLVNHLIGRVTGVGSNLPNGSYLASYELDPRMLNISSLIPDCIKLESLEYPAGQEPPTTPTFSAIGDYISLRGSDVTLIENKQLRVIYLGRWTSPTSSSKGDFPSHLNDAVIIGSSGQALIFKAEGYVREAANALGVLTPPAAYIYEKPTAPVLPGVPSAPTAPVLTFTSAEGALSNVGTRATSGAGYLTTGRDLINRSTRGDAVGATFGQYGNIEGNLASVYVQQALGFLRRIENEISRYSGQVTAFGSEVNAYANQVSGLISRYREQVGAEDAGIKNFSAQVSRYAAQVSEQEIKTRNFLEIAGRCLASGQAKINEFLIMLGVKIEFPQSKASPEQRA